jgi:NADH-quinone oxidoreductase subunit L
MLAMVTGVSLLVALFGSGYMHHDPGYPRFFAAVSMFVFSMCMLVLSNSFVLLFVFWEMVGLCSYLLIGFWFGKPSAAAASKKAFVLNRIGDFGLIMAIFLIWTNFGAIDFLSVLNSADHIASVEAANPGVIQLICFCLFLGAMGKSAQFPLQVWLPDAMEGPTPVSRSHPCSHHGDRRRLPRGALHATICLRTARSDDRLRDRGRHRSDRSTDCLDSNRPEKSPCVLHR